MNQTGTSGRKMFSMSWRKHSTDLTNYRRPDKIVYSKIYMEVVMRKDKNIMIRVSRETHTAFKKKVAEEGTTMSRIIRELVGVYLSGELKLTASD